MKIGLIGGSNSAYKKGYTSYLRKKNIELNNYAIGGVNSVYGLMQMVKHDIAKNNDIVIFEYMVNDVNRCYKLHYDVERTKKTLVEIVNLCAQTKTKLLLIYIFPRNLVLSGKMYTCPMSNLYKKFAKEHNLTVLDVCQLLAKKYGEKWSKYFDDDIHPNNAGRQLMASGILDLIKHTTIPNFIENEIGFNNPKIIKLKDYLPSKNYKNSLINIDYVEIFKKIKIKFDKKAQFILIEYADSEDTGFIEIGNRKKKIHKSTIIKDRMPNGPSFKKVSGKTMVSNIALNQHCMEDDDFLIIKILPFSKVKKNLYDIDIYKWEYVETSNRLAKKTCNSQFNIISLFVSNDANIIKIDIEEDFKDKLVDAKTNSSRVVVFDEEARYSHPGYFEHNPEDWDLEYGEENKKQDYSPENGEMESLSKSFSLPWPLLKKAQKILTNI